MQFIRGLSQLDGSHAPSSVSIGNYDGVHLGHQHVISSLLEKSRTHHAASTVVTFEPLAKEFFQPNSVVRLTSIEERAELLFELGVDRVVCIDFTAEFAAYSPLKFIERVLLKGLGVKYLCVGDDFRFGKDRVGNFDFLRQVGAKRGFDVSAHDTFTVDGDRVSSGRVRAVLANDDFAMAARLLGRPYSISGVVSRGQQLGRTLGFPTANIVLGDVLMPVSGVYAVNATVGMNTSLKGVANVGTRPTVDGNENRLEVHLFDFNQTIYGQLIKVEFYHKVRDEQKFTSKRALQAQISSDIVAAKEYLSEF